MKVRIRTTKKQFIAFIILSGIFFLSFYLYVSTRPITGVVIDGTQVNFRQDLREAEKIPIFPPSEDDIFNELFNTGVINITFVFKDAGESQNPYYILEMTEIINKLTFAYSRINREVNFNAIPIDSYDNINATYYNPVIALIHPIYANSTFVMHKDHIIYISGKTYKEFDLATIKFLMIALNIKI
jgi:hypothetical protein